LTLRIRIVLEVTHQLAVDRSKAMNRRRETSRKGQTGLFPNRGGSRSTPKLTLPHAWLQLWADPRG